LRAEIRINMLIQQLADSTVSVSIVPDFFTFTLIQSKWSNVQGIPIISVFDTPFNDLDGVAKRIEDLMLSMIILPLIAFPMLIIAIAIKLTSPGPAIFKQKRLGLKGEEIEVWKFRSMTVCENGDQIIQATQNDMRITPLGAFLRRTSLDELPQFLNVLQGTMSVVGPRPHAIAHNEYYRKQIQGYMLRHKVKPGITGQAQINGCRGETDTLDKMGPLGIIRHAWKLSVNNDLDFSTDEFFSNLQSHLESRKQHLQFQVSRDCADNLMKPCKKFFEDSAHSRKIIKEIAYNAQHGIPTEPVCELLKNQFHPEFLITLQDQMSLKIFKCG